MTKYQFDVKKIHCVKPTRWEWGKDEIYFAAIAIGCKINNPNNNGISENDISGKILKAHVSDVNDKVKRETVWAPEDSCFDFEINDENLLIIKLMLYEEDSGRHHQSLKKAFVHNNFNIDIKDAIDYERIKTVVWDNIKEVSKVIIATGGNKIVIAMTVLKAIFSIAPTIIKEFKKDDFISSRVAVFILDEKDTICLPREYEFMGDGAEYKVGVELSEVE
ncbi:MAG: hypothetical protein SVZ03_01815 [Spirochaetota bacterium]|nr:hypothetical protein [Spirochaetota bacterium]